MRVCFVGDSHLGAVKRGWDVVSGDYPGFDVTFFGAPMSALEHTAVENGRLVPTSDRARDFFVMSSRGKDALVPSEFDIIVMVAMRYELGVLLDIYEEHRNEGQKNPEGDFRPVSDAYFVEMAKLRLARCRSLVYRRKLLEANPDAGAEIWIYPTPMPSETTLDLQPVRKNEREQRRHAMLLQAIKWGDGPSLEAAMLLTRETFARDGIVIFEQLPATRSRGILTRKEFSEGALRFLGENIADPDADFTHMNADYGALVVRQVLDRLQETPLGRGTG